ncbi:heme o synthase [Roseibacillus ishigakijimensis]|uniref:heme o synthase n=1 Tax=Roseibacillus ishigakijimensis TaxID=454146 RepID=UPI001F259C6C|nr:heme o synthase [Roseibacillus ishigakijimensis]
MKTLVKARLNLFVIITTFFGYAIACRGGGWEFWTLLHLLIGTTACAFGSAVFNQLSEVDSDALMARTANRPLPARRIGVVPAFVIGWGLSAFGIVHLWNMVGFHPGWIAAATIATYVFIYTPMKKLSSANTLVGAVPGALPPLIGWTAGGGGLAEAGGWYLFALLFLWQLPHFVAINWLCREEYELAGYKMWSNGDVSGKRSVSLAVGFSLGLGLLSVLVLPFGLASWPFVPIGLFLAGMLVATGQKFLRSGERVDFRRFFLATLLYLPLVLIALWAFWRV